MGQCHQFIQALFRRIIAFHAGRGRSEDRKCPGDLRAISNEIACIVFGIIFVFVAVLMLLIDDNDADIGKRGKQRGTRADADIHLPLFATQVEHPASDIRTSLP